MAGLSRETSLLALPSLWTAGGKDNNPHRYGASAGLSAANLRTTLVAVLPLAAWIAYVRCATGPGDQGWGNFALPLSGLLAKWRSTVLDVRSSPDALLPWTTLLALGALTVQLGTFAATARKGAFSDPWWRMGALYAILMLFLGGLVWEGYPGAATRVLLPLALAFNVLACRRRLALLWLLAGNLTVPAGLVSMKDKPSHPREIAAAHSGEWAYLVRIDAGWYKVEHPTWHDRAWTSQRGGLLIEAWPRGTRTATLDFSTRALRPCTVEVRQGGALLWRGTVEAAYREIVVPFELVKGKAVLELSTDAPPVREGAGQGGRLLGFNVRDPEVRIGEPSNR